MTKKKKATKHLSVGGLYNPYTEKTVLLFAETDNADIAEQIAKTLDARLTKETEKPSLDVCIDEVLHALGTCSVCGRKLAIATIGAFDCTTGTHPARNFCANPECRKGCEAMGGHYFIRKHWWNLRRCVVCGVYHHTVYPGFIPKA